VKVVRIGVVGMNSLYSLVALFFIMICTACAAFDGSRARVAYYEYIDLRSDAGKALKKRDCETAEAKMKQAVDVAKKLYSLEPKTATTLTEAYKLLGQVYASDCYQRFEEAISVYKVALNMRQTLLGRNSTLVANVMNDLGWTYYKYGDFIEAESNLIAADQIYTNLEILKKEQIFPQYNLSNLYRSQNRMEKELEYSKKTVDTAESLYFSGKFTGPKTAFYLREYATSLKKAGEIEKAAFYESRAKKLESEE